MTRKAPAVSFPSEKLHETPTSSIVLQLGKEIETKTANSSAKLRQFMEEYEKVFKKELPHKGLTFDITESRVMYMMKGALTFYALNMNGQVLIELAGLLERYAIAFIEELFWSLRSIQLLNEVQPVIVGILEKKFLDELTKHLITLGLWDKEDEEEVKELYSRRNSVVHKNTRKIKAIVGSNKAIPIPDIDLAMSNFDVLPYMFITIKLLAKLLDRFIPKTERYRIATVILEGKIADEIQYFRE